MINVPNLLVFAGFSDIYKWQVVVIEKEDDQNGKQRRKHAGGSGHVVLLDNLHQEQRQLDQQKSHRREEPGFSVKYHQEDDAEIAQSGEDTGERGDGRRVAEEHKDALRTGGSGCEHIGGNVEQQQRDEPGHGREAVSGKPLHELFRAVVITDGLIPHHTTLTSLAMSTIFQMITRQNRLMI